MTAPILLAPIILASTSEIRAQILSAVGMDFDRVASGVDEAPIKAAAIADGADPEEIARQLADAKALAVSRLRPDAVVIGADQLLVWAGAILDKPSDLADAEARLRAMRGQSHDLVGVVALAKGGAILDRHTEVSRLTMREFSDAALAAHMATGGVALLSSVGGYRLEAEGAHLFAQVDGDHSAILGLPLLPTLSMLRRAGALLS